MSHARLRADAHVLVLLTRILLGISLLVAGLPKLQGRPWLRTNLEPWIVPFFDALHDSGVYWRFLGLSEMTAGLLLLLPRTALLGALVSLPILANIFVITVSLPFRGTVIGIAGLMLTANLGLLARDYQRLRPILQRPPASVQSPPRGLRPLVLGVAGTALTIIALHLAWVFWHASTS
jgi:uncharacterized membrane protein YphA (DoxX/SURF4 family)